MAACWGQQAAARGLWGRSYLDWVWWGLLTSRRRCRWWGRPLCAARVWRWRLSGGGTRWAGRLCIAWLRLQPAWEGAGNQWLAALGQGRARGSSHHASCAHAALPLPHLPLPLHPDSQNPGSQTHRWEDIGGLPEVKRRLRQAVEWPLQHADAFARLGLSAPRGVLLHGPPGCSKTQLARAAAAGSGATFLPLSCAQLYSMYLGEGGWQLGCTSGAPL